MKKIFLALIMCFTLVGCGPLIHEFPDSYGNEELANVTDESLARDLIKGKTTKAEVRQMFGEPETVMNNQVYFKPGTMKTWSDTTWWFYSYGDLPGATITIIGSFKSKEGVKKTKNLKIIFDNKGTVIDWELISSRTKFK